MIEDLINKAKKDKRVDIDCVINNNIHMFKATGNNKNEKAILYVHGLGANKNWITRFYRQLLDNNIDVYSIDLVSHGNDITSFKKFNVTNCVQYIKDTLNYLKDNYNKVYLFGSSYGGFVILNAYNEVINYVDNIYLMCPAINFCEIMEEKVGGLNIDYYNNHDFLPLYNNIKIYKNTYKKLKKGDEFIKHNKFKKVFIIQGDNDTTVNVNNIVKFCNDNNLKYKIINNGKHELYGYDSEIIEFILNN